MGYISVSIIILTKNAGQNLKKLLEKIFTQSFDGEYEVLIVDSGSTDETLDIVKNFPIRIAKIKSSEFHHGKTRNLGAKLAKGEILVYVTQDALPLKNNWVQNLINNFENPNVVAVYGRQIPRKNAKPPEKFFYSYYFPPDKIAVRYNGSTDYVKYYKDNVFISNVNSAIRRDVWEKFKFSENIITSEDKEFAKRVLLAGYAIAYEPDAPVFHSHDFTLKSVLKKYFEFGVALSQGVKGLPKSSKPAITKIIEYFSCELKYLYGNKQITSIPYAILYDVCKFIGLFVGKNKKYLPRILLK